MENIEQIISIIIAVLVAAQSIIVYLLPPEKASKYNWIGKILTMLGNTKGGFSGKIPSSN